MSVVPVQQKPYVALGADRYKEVTFAVIYKAVSRIRLHVVTLFPSVVDDHVATLLRDSSLMQGVSCLSKA